MWGGVPGNYPSLVVIGFLADAQTVRPGSSVDHRYGPPFFNGALNRTARTLQEPCIEPLQEPPWPYGNLKSSPDDPCLKPP